MRMGRPPGNATWPPCVCPQSARSNGRSPIARSPSGECMRTMRRPVAPSIAASTRGAPYLVVVEPADRDVVEWRRECHAAIGRASARRRARARRRSRESSRASHGCRARRIFRTAPGSFRAAEPRRSMSDARTDTKSPPSKRISGRSSVSCVAGAGEQSAIRRGAGVEVGGERHAERCSRRSFRDVWFNRRVRHAKPALEPKPIRQRRRPVEGTERGVELEFDGVTGAV